MEFIRISTLVKRQKKYLKKDFQSDFASLYHLVFYLFDNYEHGHKEVLEIEKLLEQTGYDNLKEIPKSELERIRKIIQLNLPQWEAEEDSEYLSYKLMAAILTKRVVVILDDEVVEDTERHISIRPDAVISFINNDKLDSITFTIL